MQIRIALAELLEVNGGEALDHPFAAGGQALLDATAVFRGGPPAHELDADQTVDEADRAVMLELEAPGQLRDRHIVATGKTLDRQQRLVLRRQTGVAGCLLAEIEELPQCPRRADSDS